MAERSIILSVADYVRRWWWFIRRPFLIGAAGMVIDAENRVLLVRHSYGSRQWRLPGGAAKRQETLAEAAMRELREEVGVIVTGGAAGLTMLGLYANFTQYKSDHIGLFVARDFERVPTRNFEIAAAEFFPIDALPADTADSVRRRIAEFTGAEPVAPHW